MPKRELVTSLDTKEIQAAIVEYIYNKYNDVYEPREVVIKYEDLGYSEYGRPQVVYTASVSKQPDG